MQEKLFLALMETQAAHWELSRKGFQELDLPNGQPKVLYILQAVEGCVQKELARICKIRPSSMTVLLEKTEQNGYIYKETAKVSGGKRAFCIYLTEEGRSLAAKITDLVECLEEKSFQGFSEEEKQTLFCLLDRVTKNLEG